jgi:transposase
MAASPGPLPVLLPDPAHVSVDSVQLTEGVVVIVAGASGETAICPVCGSSSCHVHSQYGRTLFDLSWQGARVRIELNARRFYCRSQDCRRKIFTERFPSLTVSYGRQTSRHHELLKRIGYALGGQGGFRLASQLGMDSSPDTILRAVKRGRCPMPCSPVKALGVDDWAWRKGQRYGTILVDLERRQPIDLLPDRESGTLEKWLEDRQGIEIISRDRAGAYAEGARKGAPQAIQVADRFHLLCNITQAMQRLLDRLAVALRRSQISEAALSKDLSSTGSADVPSEATVPACDPPRLNQLQQQSQQRRERRKARYEAVRAAHQRGLTQRAIARELDMTRKTVRRFLQAADFPERVSSRRRTALEPHREYLEKRWADGCHNASQLWRELRQRGYPGQFGRVKQFLQPWRLQGPKPKPHHQKLPGLRLVAFWLSKPAGDRKEKEQQWVQQVTNDHPEIGTAENLAQRFRLFRNFGGTVMATERDSLPHHTGMAGHGFAKGGNPLGHTSDASAA